MKNKQEEPTDPFVDLETKFRELHIFLNNLADLVKKAREGKNDAG